MKTNARRKHGGCDLYSAGVAREVERSPDAIALCLY